MSQTTPERRGEAVTRAYSDLREAILDGVYLPGNRLSQKELSETLSVGRTPLREALRMLEGDGLIVSAANQGVRVAPAVLGAAEELYSIRFLLEPPVMAALTSQFTHAELDSMESHLATMTAAVHRTRDFQKAHFAFHSIGLSRYGDEVGRLVLQLHSRVALHQRLHMSRPRVPDDFLSVDRALLAALRARHPAEVRWILEFHLLDSAIGLILDVEPDHQFGPLVSVAQTNGVTLEVDSNGCARRPAQVWLNRDAESSWPSLQTSNLLWDPPPANGRQS